MSGWQPISTVPVSTLKENGDWSEVLAWNMDYDRCDVVRVDMEQRCFWGDWQIVVQASHWMHLPERPQ